MYLVQARRPPDWIVIDAHGNILRRATEDDVVAAGASLGGAPWPQRTSVDDLDREVHAMAHIVARGLAQGHRHRARRPR